MRVNSLWAAKRSDFLDPKVPLRSSAGASLEVVLRAELGLVVSNSVRFGPVLVVFHKIKFRSGPAPVVFHKLKFRSGSVLFFLHILKFRSGPVPDVIQIFKFRSGLFPL